MKFFGLILFLFFWGSHFGSAKDVQPSFKLSRDPQGRIVAEASTCQEISDQASSFERWVKSVSTGRCFSVLPKSFGRSCRADFTECVPELARNVFGKTAKLEGPNCIGLALAIAGLSPAVNEGNDQEIAYFLTSPLCHEVASDERMPGDIVVVEKQDEIIHAYIFVNQNACFTKNGRTSESQYVFQKEREINDLYGDPYSGECEACRGNESKPSCAYCMAPIHTRSFRCKKFEDYLIELKNQKRVPERTLNDMIGVEASVECSVSKVLFGKTPLDSSQLQLIKNGVVLTAKLYDQVANESCELGPDSQEACRPVLSAMQIRLMRLKDTLQGIDLRSGRPWDTEFYSKLYRYVKETRFKSQSQEYFKKFPPVQK